MVVCLDPELALPLTRIAARSDLVSEKFARMCERAVLTNRPSLELSPYRPKAIEA
jgi:hypothetical protein